MLSDSCIIGLAKGGENLIEGVYIPPNCLRFNRETGNLSVYVEPVDGLTPYFMPLCCNSPKTIYDLVLNGELVILSIQNSFFVDELWYLGRNNSD